MGSFNEKLARVDMVVSQLIEEKKSIAFSIGVISQNEKILNKTYGKLALNKDRICDTQSLFCVGSLSKSFTSLAILMLAEQDKLSIEDVVSDYIPLKLNGKEKEIKIKHLMSHSSGLPNIFLCVIIEKKLGERADYNGLDFDKEINDWEDLFQFINDQADFITSKPGERFHYSDTSFSLLQYVIEKVSGISYPNFLRKYIFNPLEMKNATVRSQFVDNGNATNGHLTDKQTMGKGVVSTVHNYPISELADGGGGVMASNEDLFNYLSMMMNGGIFKNKKIISTSIYKQLITPFVMVNQSRGISYGYGWLLMEQNDKLFVFHPGNTGASTCLFGFMVEDEFGMFITNNITYPPLPVYAGLIEIISDHKFGLPKDDILSVTKKDFVGSYRGIGDVEHVKIENVDGDLYVIFISVDVYGNKKVNRPLRQAGEEYYFIGTQGKVRVYLESINDQQWLTIGINKYKKE